MSIFKIQYADIYYNIYCFKERFKTKEEAFKFLIAQFAFQKLKYKNLEDNYKVYKNGIIMYDSGEYIIKEYRRVKIC